MQLSGDVLSSGSQGMKLWDNLALGVFCSLSGKFNLKNRKLACLVADLRLLRLLVGYLAQLCEPGTMASLVALGRGGFSLKSQKYLDS